MKIIRSISIRIEEQLLKKLHYIADYEGRSANSQMLHYIRKDIREFEEKHGEIMLQDTDTTEL